MVVRKMVTENLGSSGPPQRIGSKDRPVSAEELALTAAHEATRAVFLLWQSANRRRVGDPGQPEADELELGEKLDGLYDAWETIGAWKPGDDRVPVHGEPGSARVDWEG